MLKLNPSEFELLKGTDLIIDMLRARVAIPVEHVEWLDNFMDINGTGLYYPVVGTEQVIVYCERAVDAENITRIVQNYNS